MAKSLTIETLCCFLVGFFDGLMRGFDGWDRLLGLWLTCACRVLGGGRLVWGFPGYLFFNSDGHTNNII